MRVHNGPSWVPGTEDELQTELITQAKALGWRVTHIRPGRDRHGRVRTQYQGHTGLPDVTLAKGGQVYLVELKSRTGRVTAEQREWLDAAGPFGRLWRPADWPEIHRFLRTAGT